MEITLYNINNAQKIKSSIYSYIKCLKNIEPNIFISYLK